MMRINCLIPLFVLLSVVSSHANAVDLSKLPRTISAEPEYHTQPKYCLLVFGPGAKTSVWLVHDGDTLYADLNGNSDLTDQAERIAAHEDSSADDKTYRFDVGELREGKLLHKGLSVSTMNLQHLAQSDSSVREVLSTDPQARLYRLGIDLQMPLHRGAGIEGRVEHLVGPIDAGGVLAFADKPEEAPIIHFGGPWQVTLYSGAELTVGRQTEVFLAMGTPGLGPGTTAFAAYRDLVPAGICPTLHVAFPGDDENPIEYNLRERCCTVNFHGGVRLANDAPTGEATVRITFDDWLGGSAAPTTHKVKVVKPKVEFTLEPVSPRLKKSLMHPTRDGMIVGIRYSPDGTRVVAGDYPGGIVQLWDIETGDQLTTLETGYGFRSSDDYFHVTPDWQVVLTPQRQRKSMRVERDGKRRIRWEFSGDIRCRDLATGELQWQLQDSPQRGIIHTVMSPDGKYVASLEELPGETDGHPERRTSLWNTQSATRREFSDLHIQTFSPDGNRFAAAPQTEEGHNTSLEVYDIETGQRMFSIPITEQPAWAYARDFMPDGAHLIGEVTIIHNQKDRSTWKSALIFWDAATGEEVGSIAPGNNGEGFSGVAAFSPDGRTYALGNSRGERAELYLIDVVDKQISRTVDLGENSMIRGQIFSPDGRWIAATTQSIPENLSGYTNEQDLPQPRIHLIEAATGEVRETMVAPQSFIASLCFSPDGKTLASSGPGRVLLWDLSPPPGELVK